MRNMYIPYVKKCKLFTMLLCHNIAVVMIGDHNCIEMRSYIKNYAIDIAYQGCVIQLFAWADANAVIPFHSLKPTVIR